MVPSTLLSVICHFLAPAQELQPLWSLAVTLLTFLLPNASRYRACPLPCRWLWTTLASYALRPPSPPWLLLCPLHHFLLTLPYNLPLEPTNMLLQSVPLPTKYCRLPSGPAVALSHQGDSHSSFLVPCPLALQLAFNSHGPQ